MGKSQEGEVNGAIVWASKVRNYIYCAITLNAHLLISPFITTTPIVVQKKKKILRYGRLGGVSSPAGRQA